MITGFRTEVAPEALGRSLQAIVSVKLQPSGRTTIGTFAARTAEMPGVMHVYFLGGTDDFQIHFAAQSSENLRDFVTTLSAMAEVASTQTSIIFDHMTGRGSLV